MASSKRTLSTAALLVSAVLVLAACSGGEGGSGDGTIELRIAVGGAADNHETEPESPIAIGLSEEIGATVLRRTSPRRWPQATHRTCSGSTGTSCRPTSIRVWCST